MLLSSEDGRRPSARAARRDSMNLIDLGYFVIVAETENLREASRRSGVSPAALSKAMRRIEVDLATTLFDRRAGALHLNVQGEHLKRRAGRLLHDAGRIRDELAGPSPHVHLRIAGPESLLSPFAVTLAARLRERYSDCDVRIRTTDEVTAVNLVATGECEIGLVSEIGDRRAEEAALTRVAVGDSTSRVGVGATHPLAVAAGDAPIRLHVAELLEYPFAVPESALFASRAFEKTPDGWRDDVFPRRAFFRADSLQTLAGLVRRGLAAAYLPGFLCEEWGLRLVEVSGCTFTCQTAVVAVHAREHERGWMNQFLAFAFKR